MSERPRCVRARPFAQSPPALSLIRVHSLTTRKKSRAKFALFFYLPHLCTAKQCARLNALHQGGTTLNASSQKLSIGFCSQRWGSVSERPRCVRARPFAQSPPALSLIRVHSLATRKKSRAKFALIFYLLIHLSFQYIIYHFTH